MSTAALAWGRDALATHTASRAPSLPSLLRAGVPPGVADSHTGTTVQARHHGTTAARVFISRLGAVREVDDDIALLADEADEALDRIVARLRHRDDALALKLFRLALDPEAEPDTRGLALESLAMAKLSGYEPLVSLLIQRLLRSPKATLRFGAVAAASDVSLVHRSALRRAIEERTTDAEPRAEVRRAALSFLAADAARPR